MRRVVLLLVVLGCGSREEGVSVELSVHVSALAAAPDVAVSDASVRVTSVTLVPCETTVDKVWRALSPISTAWAQHDHSHHGSALQPVTVSLTGEPHQYLGMLMPNAGRYCSAQVELAALHVAGTRGGVPFELGSSAERVVKFPVAVVLDEEHKSADLMLKLGPADLPIEPDAERLFDSVATSMRAP